MKFAATVAALVMFAAFCPAQEEPKKVSKAEAMSAVLSKVQPEYPPVARQVRVQGTVELEALITESGAVEKVDIVSGNALLTGPSAATVKRWKFKPFLESGKPVKVIAPIELVFKL